MKRRITPPSAAGSAKKRRLEVSALNDDADDGDGIIFEGLALEDSSEDDQMERKRRRQLAERWSKLEKDSVSSDMLSCVHPFTFLPVGGRG